MESVAFDLDPLKIFVWNDDADRVGSRIELAAYLQSGPRRGIGDKVDDTIVRGQRTVAWTRWSGRDYGHSRLNGRRMGKRLIRG